MALFNRESDGLSVFRAVFLAGFAFVWGSPQFADLRPHALDVPLVNFHYDMKSVAHDAVFVVESIDAVRDLEFMTQYFDVVTGRLST